MGQHQKLPVRELRREKPGQLTTVVYVEAIYHVIQYEEVQLLVECVRHRQEERATAREFR